MLRERSSGEPAFLTLVETEHGDRKNKLFTIVSLGHLKSVAVSEVESGSVVNDDSSPRRSSLRRTKQNPFGACGCSLALCVVLAPAHEGPTKVLIPTFTRLSC